MAILMDSLNNLDHSVRRKFKKIFAQLSDDYVVRSPSQPSIQVATLLIEGPHNRWLLLGLHPDIPKPDDLTKYRSLSLVLERTYQSFVNYLAIVELEDAAFTTQPPAASHMITLEYSEFFPQGADFIKKYSRKLPDEAHQWLKKQVFPETHIQAECSSRRHLPERDSSAQLQPFFLDYDQEKAAKLDILDEFTSRHAGADDDFSVRLINGVAGSGKTLILINRVILYCKRFPEHRVLFLIHNKPITSDIEYKLENYLKGVPDNLTITTFHAFALAQKKRLSGYVQPLFVDSALQPFKRQLLSQDNWPRNKLNLSDQQIWSEIEYINEHLIENKQSYLTVERQGRGFPLQKNQREWVWQIYEQSTRLLCNRTGYLPSLYIREMCLQDDDTELERFDHILLDEAQFFCPAWLKLVLKSLKNQGQLFMCADPNQGFLKSGLSWKSLGLDVRGRTQKLHYSYRTTYEILLAANALLEELSDDPEDFIKPDLANMSRGDKPRIIYCDTSQDELMRFLNELQHSVAEAKLPLNQMMVLCGDKVSPYTLKPAIDSTLGGGKAVNCNDAKDLKNHYGERIKVMSINSCTGMEAGITFVLGVGDILNAEHDLDLNEEEKIQQRHRSLRKLYVAMTRAGQKLVLFSTKKLPPRINQYLQEQ